MLNSSLLNILIACVVVFLLLSLLVQAIQAAFKKLFALKSRQIEASLVDLFQNALGQLQATIPRGWARWRNLPGLDFLLGDHPSTFAASDVQALYGAVRDGFTQIGRTAANGSLMFDSLAKGDFLKVLDKVPAGKLFGQQAGTPAAARLTQIADAVEQAFTKITDFSRQMTALEQAVANHPDARAKFAGIKVAVQPLLSDLTALQSGGAVGADVLLGDLGKMSAAGAALQQLLTTVQRDLHNALAQTPDLQPVAAGVDALADTLDGLGQQLDAAMAPLRARRAELEDWFDTIMQSFEERYARSMKSWAIAISLAVAVTFNASVFELYKNVSTDETLRGALVNEGQKMIERKAHPAAEDPKKDVPLKQVTDDVRAQLDASLSEYEIFGFKPFWQAFGPWLKRSQTDQGSGLDWWWHWAGVGWHLLGRVIGWIAMALLLSVGAPFWQDALESLFGVKNILRQSSDTQNVEQNRGGQPHS